MDLTEIDRHLFLFPFFVIQDLSVYVYVKYVNGVHLKIRYKCELFESSFTIHSKILVEGSVEKEPFVKTKRNLRVDGNRSTSIFGPSSCNNLRFKVFMCT